MTIVVFNTATTIDGFIADDADSLDWLFAVPGADEAENDFNDFLAGVGVLVMGSTTYEWIHHHQLSERPETWSETYGERLAFVFTTRELPVAEGLDTIRFTRGAVVDAWPDIEAAAKGRDIWIVGGGDLAGQFADAGLLDEVRVSVAPTTLGSGRPLLPRRLESDRLELRAVRRVGSFAELVYRVGRPPTE